MDPTYDPEKVITDLLIKRSSIYKRLSGTVELLTIHHKQIQILYNIEEECEQQILRINHQIEKVGDYIRQQHNLEPTKITKSSFINAIREMTGKYDVKSDLENLRANANTVMNTVIASYHTAAINHSMTWDELPTKVKLLAIEKLETMVHLNNIRLVEDHWIATYLLNEQCIPIRWEIPPSPSFRPHHAFVLAIQEAHKILPPPFINEESTFVSASIELPFLTTLEEKDASQMVTTEQEGNQIVQMDIMAPIMPTRDKGKRKAQDDNQPFHSDKRQSQ